MHPVILPIIGLIVGIIMVWVSWGNIIPSFTGHTEGGYSIGGIINIGGEYVEPNYAMGIFWLVLTVIGIVLFLWGLIKILRMVIDKIKSGVRWGVAKAKGIGDY